MPPPVAPPGRGPWCASPWAYGILAATPSSVHPFCGPVSLRQPRPSTRLASQHHPLCCSVMNHKTPPSRLPRIGRPWTRCRAASPALHSSLSRLHMCVMYGQSRPPTAHTWGAGLRAPAPEVYTWVYTAYCEALKLHAIPELLIAFWTLFIISFLCAGWVATATATGANGYLG